MDIKVVIVGDGAVGKTNFLLSGVNHIFPEDYNPTVVDNFSTETTYKDKTVGLTLWDTAGQEDFDELRPLSYPDTHVFIIGFDVSNSTSLENIEAKWIKEVRHHCPTTPVILVALKCDLRNDPRKGHECITDEQAKKVQERIGAVCYRECSAKQHKGIEEIFQLCAQIKLDPESLGIKSPNSNSANTNKQNEKKDERRIIMEEVDVWSCNDSLRLGGLILKHTNYTERSNACT
ncbi:hypothetical protein C9374_004127 [Naegleria lovaniensis]|uniref:Rho family small GTPase n=1 Tax=Naegleria lovaniensis TaxID=51637 RepID=A0AA88GQH5_NAELO|nr:uncharacterized protein C9374_004127 [Naegleria lovaniensis]KAG2383456.1 hypothetical protein C9374_004127 [Naegleria lovaniensis]